MKKLIISFLLLPLLSNAQVMSVTPNPSPSIIAISSSGVANLEVGAINATAATWDTSVLWVTNQSSFFYGSYTQYWGTPYSVSGYGPKQGVWKSTTTTNLIYFNDPGANIGGVGWVLEGHSNSTDLYYKDQSTTNSNPIGSWVGTDSGGFNGSIYVTWGTNIATASASGLIANSSYFVAAFSDTNVLRVEQWGDDDIANRTNGYPFRTWRAANWAATNGVKVIKVGPGNYGCRSFYSRPDLYWKGSGQGSTFATFWSTNFTGDGGPDIFNASGFVMNTNVELSDITFTNCGIIFSDRGPGTPDDITAFPINCYVHDITVIRPWEGGRLEGQGGTGDTYLGIGIAGKGIADATFENVKIYSGFTGFEFIGYLDGSSLPANDTNRWIRLINCYVECSPQYARNNTNAVWNSITIDSDGIGGMWPISVRASKKGMNIIIEGGTYISLNGGTNVSAASAGVTNTSRNACLYIAPITAATNEWSFDFRGPRFIHGSTNTTTFAILNENNAMPRMYGFYAETSVKDRISDQFMTNTFVLEGVKYRTHVTTPLVSEVETNGAMIWKSNGIVRLLTATNGTLNQVKLGP